MDNNVSYISGKNNKGTLINNYNQNLSEILEELNSKSYKEFLSSYDVFPSYKEARNFCENNNLKLEAHHIIPRSYQIKKLKLDEYDNLWRDHCVLLTREDHLKAHYILARDLKGFFIRIFVGMIHFMKKNNFDINILDPENPTRVIMIIEEGEILRNEVFRNISKMKTPEEKRASIEKGKITRKETFQKHPELWEKIVENITKTNRDPLRRKLAAEKQKSNWENPLYRENQLASFRSPSCRKKHSLNNGMHMQETRDKISGERNVMKNPEIKKKHLEICRSEDHRRKISESHLLHPEKNAMNVLAYREKHSKIMKLRSLVYWKLKNLNSDIRWWDFCKEYSEGKYNEIKESILLENEDLRT